MLQLVVGYPLEFARLTGLLKVIHSVSKGHGFGGNVFSLVHLDDLAKTKSIINFLQIALEDKRTIQSVISSSELAVTP